jgi:hypothetical protein
MHIHDYKMVYKCKYCIHLDLNVSTTNISVYTPESTNETILSLEDELLKTKIML